MIYEIPDLKLRFSKEIVTYFLSYLHQCADNAFIGRHYYIDHEPIREKLLRHSLNSLREKITNILFKNVHQNNKKLITIRISQVERITMSAIFLRVEIPSALAEVEMKILDQLTLKPY